MERLIITVGTKEETSCRGPINQGTTMPIAYRGIWFEGEDSALLVATCTANLGGKCLVDEKEGKGRNCKYGLVTTDPRKFYLLHDGDFINIE